MTMQSMSPDKKESKPAIEATEGGMVKCPYCFSEIDGRASICPHCGKNLKVKTGRYQGASFLMALGLLAALADLFIGTGILLVGGILLFLIAWVIRRNA